VLLISKLLSLLIYPLSLALLLLLLSLVSRLRGAAARSNFFVVLATAWLYLCASEWGANLFMAPLEAAYPGFANEELPEAEAIVILGGGLSGESRFGPGGDFNDAADRIWRGASLYQQGKAPLLILSGGTTLEGALPEATLMSHKLTAIGIPQAAMLLEADSRTTRENAQYTKALLEERRIRHVLLVTSAAHMRRAARLFGAQGVVVTAVPTDHQTPLMVGPVPGWLPTVDRLARTTRAIHEWVAYWIYERLGYFDPADASLDT